MTLENSEFYLARAQKELITALSTTGDPRLVYLVNAINSTQIALQRPNGSSHSSAVYQFAALARCFENDFGNVKKFINEGLQEGPYELNGRIATAYLAFYALQEAKNIRAGVDAKEATVVLACLAVMDEFEVRFSADVISQLSELSLYVFLIMILIQLLTDHLQGSNRTIFDVFESLALVETTNAWPPFANIFHQPFSDFRTILNIMKDFQTKVSDLKSESQNYFIYTKPH